MKVVGVFSVFLFLSLSILGQEVYNSCNNAQPLCPGPSFSANNIGATSTFCPNCEDDFNFCFSGENTVWFSITTADSGSMSVFISNIAFEQTPGAGNALQAILLEASIPCVPSSYSLVADCEASFSTPTVLFAEELDSNAVYYLVINGEMGTSSNAEASFDISISGSAVDKDPGLFIGTTSDTLCKGSLSTIVATLTDCETHSPVNWFFDEELVATTSGLTLVTDELYDSVTVRAELECLENCGGELISNEIVLEVHSFFIDAGSDFEITAGESVQLQGDADADSIYWTPISNMSDPNALNPFVSPLETTNYFLVATDSLCTLTDFMTVTVESDLTIPNTFSPNGDGVNDTWEILGIEAYPDCFIQIYTRWGQLVFQTTGYPSSQRWDGTSSNGRALSPGVYYYVIRLRDEDNSEPIKGHINLVR